MCDFLYLVHNCYHVHRLPKFVYAVGIVLEVKGPSDFKMISYMNRRVLVTYDEWSRQFRKVSSHPTQKRGNGNLKISTNSSKEGPRGRRRDQFQKLPQSSCLGRSSLRSVAEKVGKGTLLIIKRTQFYSNTFQTKIEKNFFEVCTIKACIWVTSSQIPMLKFL